MKKIKAYLIDSLLPKHQNRIYARPMGNCYLDKYDIVNKGSSNLFMLLDYLATTPHKEKLILYVEYGDRSREEVYAAYAAQARKNNIELKFLYAGTEYKSKLDRALQRMKNDIYRYSAKTWLVESGDYHLFGKLQAHRYCCTNYFISCKSDLVPGSDYRWKNLDYINVTGLLPAQILASVTGVRLENCKILGFPRNDTLFNSNKREQVEAWLKSEVGFLPEKIFLYAPTFRDYEDGSQGKELLGYPAEALEAFLKENKAVLIYKLHPLDRVQLKTSKYTIAYKKSYDFSLYDLMSMTDCLIGDYSSVGYDFILADKPLIYNLYDEEVYQDQRGLSYEPFSEFCAGPIVKNWEELEEALRSVALGKDTHAEKRRRIAKLLHKYQDGEATPRTYQTLFLSSPSK